MSNYRIVKVKPQDYERIKKARESEFEPNWHVVRRLLEIAEKERETDSHV
jgi:hypothetical protein